MARETRSRDWNEVADEYRTRWQARTNMTGSWADYEPAYRYGHEMANEPRFRGRGWTDVEPDLSSGYAEWSRRYGYRDEGESAWERIKDSVRDAWESITGQR